MSSLVLVYDTETSGLPLFDQPSVDPRQPHKTYEYSVKIPTKSEITPQNNPPLFHRHAVKPMVKCP